MHRMRPLAMAALLAAVSVASPGEAQQLGIGTMGQGTAGYAMGATIARVLAEKAGLQARVQPAAGTSAIVPLMDTGEIDLGVANIIESKEALTGTGPFEGRKQENIRVVAVLFPFRTGFFVRKDAPMQTMAELKGKTIPYGYTAQVTLKSVTDAFLANAGLSPSDVKTVLVPNVVRGTDEFIAGKTDAGFFALGAGKVAEANAAVGGIRFLQLDDSPAAVQRMQKLIPEAYIVTVQPSPALPGVVGPTKTMAYDYVLLAGKHVKDEIVAKVVETLAANKQSLVQGFAGFRGFDAAKMAKKLPVEYHAGAIAAYTKLGHWPPKQ